MRDKTTTTTAEVWKKDVPLLRLLKRKLGVNQPEVIRQGLQLLNQSKRGKHV